MKNIFYEYCHDKSTKMKMFESADAKAPPHFHRNVEMLYVTDGQIDATVGEDGFIAKADDVIFVHNYYVHSFMPDDHYKKYVMIIPANYGDDVDKILKSSTLPSLMSDTKFNRNNILPIFKRLLDGDKTMPPLVKKGYVNVIIGMLFEHYPTLTVKTAGNIEFMVDILHYIDEHFREPLTLDSVAATFGYNKYYFSRMFNRYIGESLSNYINVVRLQNFMRRCKEIENPQISKIAEECGFESMPTFYRAFAKIYGESPRSYFSKRS